MLAGLADYRRGLQAACAGRYATAGGLEGCVVNRLRFGCQFAPKILSIVFDVT